MDTSVPDDETLNAENVAELRKKLANVEADNKIIRDEFNVQRARLKDLFLQKEDECSKLAIELDKIKNELNEKKSQILVAEYKRENEIQHQDIRAQEEIASLQQLVHETIEESSVSKSEINRINAENERLRNEIAHLRHSPSTVLQESSTSQSTPSLAPVLNHVKKTLVRKLGGDTFSNDNLEDSMRKAQEDAEVLRSLVIPLEEEIKALKEKLRSTDEELQRTRSSTGLAQSSSTTFETEGGTTVPEKKINQNLAPHTSSNEATTKTGDKLNACEMCKNYELQLVTTQGDLENLRKEIDQCHEEASKEAELRRDLEDKWQEKRNKYNEEVTKLKNQVDHSEKELAALQKNYGSFKEEVNQEFTRLTSERENVHRHLTTLQDDNDFLAGRYLASSEEIESQLIDLPSSVEELQELLLQSHQNLVEARVGCEFAQRKCATYLDESQLLRDQLQTAWAERKASERDLSARIKSLETHLKAQEAERMKLIGIKDAYEAKEIEFNKLSSELRVQVIELREANDKLEKLNSELRGKMTVLQQELATSEAVQKDFVRLSQSLQMELEKIRAADTSVRWQDDEDADNCPSCKNSFTVTRRKLNCRHCGTIYCDKCLTKSVPTGRSNKLARVCDVCHTLLVQNTAPYFSQAPPQSPH